MELIKADLHYHGSRKSSQNFNKTIDTASRRLGSGGILGVADFDDLDRYEPLADALGYEREFLENTCKGVFYVPEKDIFVVRGQEVTTNQGQILVLGLGKNKLIKSRRNLEDSLKESADNNCKTIAVHPFAAYGTGDYLIKNPQLIGLLTAIEIYDQEAVFGWPIVKANKKVEKFYEKIENWKEFHDVGITASSDGHYVFELGTSCTLVEKPYTNKRFIGSLSENLRKVKNTSQLKRNGRARGLIGAGMHSFEVVAAILRYGRLGAKTSD